MGLRTASVRRPHVVVMAPALTDASQSQSFKLAPKTHLEPASPINSYETNSKYLTNISDSTYCKKSDTISYTLDELSNAVVDHFHPVAPVPETTQVTRSYLRDSSGASENNFGPNSGIMSSPLPMGDQENKMGLQNTGLDSVSSIHKDKTTSDADYLFNLSGVLPGPGDLGQNVDEILQVIKSIEGGCNERLNNGPNDLCSETEEGFPGDLEKAFLDVMNITIEDQPDEMDTENNMKESQAKQLLAEQSKKQAKVERRLDFLKRRVYKLQTKLMGSHISGEVAGVYEYVHRSLKRAKEQLDNPRPEASTSAVNDSMPHAPAPVLNPTTAVIKAISYGSTKTLVRKLEMTNILQANSASRQRHSARYFGSGSVEPPTFRSNVSGMINIPPWPTEVKNELHKVAGMLKTELSVVQKEVDSEATESSSGGESCDEMQNYNNPHQQYLSIQKRALWKYSTDRAAIAARWTWLQSQISDLEYRIRQHTDLHKKVRMSKGAITLGGPSPPISPNVPSSPTTVNGYRGQLPGNSPMTVKSTTDNTTSPTANGTFPPDFQCARTRPLVNFKKRKLLQIAGLHAVTKKAARPSTIRCGCAPPEVPSCALCTGRTDPTYPRDPPETMSKSERIALIDPAFHPVFSLPEDTSQSVHFEAIMKTPEWQQRSTRMKSVKVLSKAERLEKSLEHRSKKLEHRKKYTRLLKPSTMSALTAKIKNKIRGRKSGRHSLSRLNRKRHTAKVAIAQLQALAAEGADEEVEALGMNTRSLDSPNSSPLLQMQSISGFSRKNRIHSYDIDNIVIPYSVAASTRVEKLQYKEILTPKWRIADPEFATKYESKNNGVVRNPSQDSDAEDLSEEAVIARHDRCEHDEKKKFLSYLKLPLGYGRSRAHKRTDSLAESSGANTPDPMSPHPADPQENTNSPMTSPPATPLSIQMDTESTPLPSISAMRRRTISQSRFVKDKEIKDENRCITPEAVEVPPYERRGFPLNEDTYDKMVKSMPEDHQFKTNIRSQDSNECDEADGFMEEKLDSHDSESTESAVGDEDPNDPEWIEMERAGRDRHKR